MCILRVCAKTKQMCVKLVGIKQLESLSDYSDRLTNVKRILSNKYHLFIRLCKIKTEENQIKVE